MKAVLLLSMVHLKQFRELKVVICLWRSPIYWVPGVELVCCFFFGPLMNVIFQVVTLHLVGDL